MTVIMLTVSSTRRKRMSPVSMQGRNFGPDRSMFDELGSSHCTVLPSFVKQQIGSITQHASSGIPLNAREVQSKTILSMTWLNGRCGIIQSFDSKKGLIIPLLLLIPLFNRSAQSNLDAVCTVGCTSAPFTPAPDSLLGV